MIDPTRIFYFVFGLLTIGGGIQGYLGPAHSGKSIIAGSISGILLLVAGWLVQTGKVTPGLITGLIISAALAGKFLPAFFQKSQWWPAGVEGWFGVVGVVLSIL